ncbi:glycosyltransferase family 4 protein [Inediibacterium massiliense]|uniref:glycosyltransferase family 4 protein n=1 Tax=Inediibacterium massiliense TaxID=1658111 RepID=UPI0006B46E42|nr:glycosyltransferase family 4 protein [Inediibacterium massiliense]
MKVLFQIRKDYLKNPAGDTVIFNNLRKNLIQLGIKVDAYTDCNIDLQKYDMIHIFNTIRVRETYEFIRHAKKNEKKIILTPIYWDLKEYFKTTGQSEKLKFWEMSEKKRAFIFKNCDMYLPHCQEEAELIIKKYDCNTPYKVIPYGIDENFNKGETHYLKQKYGIDEYILCVGRIHIQKNQLGLIKAFQREKIPIVLVGGVNDDIYLRKCMKEAGENIYFIKNTQRSHLPSIYKSAKVHVLPSFLEYPGLVNLEAGIAGCNVITTQIGTAKSILKDFADYCNPYEINSIYKETMKAYEKKKNTQLQEFIKEHYTWEKIGFTVKQIYETMIST